jgi:hypothetical protein
VMNKLAGNNFIGLYKLIIGITSPSPVG